MIWTCIILSQDIPDGRYVFVCHPKISTSAGKTANIIRKQIQAQQNIIYIRIKQHLCTKLKFDLQTVKERHKTFHGSPLKLGSKQSSMDNLIIVWRDAYWRLESPIQIRGVWEERDNSWVFRCSTYCSLCFGRNSVPWLHKNSLFNSKMNTFTFNNYVIVITL